MGPLTSDLCGLLRQVVNLLEANGERHWSSWLSHSLEALQVSDFNGIESLLGTFGGMGSINDLVLNPRSDLGGSLCHSASANAELHRLLAQAHDLALQIRRAAAFD